MLPPPLHRSRRCRAWPQALWRLGGGVLRGLCEGWGGLAHQRREALARVINVALAPDAPCIFAEPAVIEQLQAMVGPEED